jgi:hypothetical protein
MTPDQSDSKACKVNSGFQLADGFELPRLPQLVDKARKSPDCVDSQGSQDQQN